MEIKKFKLSELSTYLYCTMQWRLRYLFGLPWFDVSPETFFSRLSRRAITEYFQREAHNVTARKADEAAVRVLEQGVAKAKKVWPSQAATLWKLQHEALLALRDLRQVYVRGRDTLIGAPIPYETSVPLQSGVTAVVHGDLDFVFMMHDRTVMRTVVVGTVTSNKDPHEDMVRWNEVRYGFAHFAVRKGLEQHRRTQVRMMPFPVVVKQPTVTIKADFGKDFKAAVKQVARGTSVQYTMPTGQPAKCMHCPYQSVCGLHLNSVHSKPSIESLAADVEHAHRDNPFREAAT